ncbi:hypothetical protein [Actinoplanes teichomyceticus]|uniref:Uncharacterized protein n=1 Tax=Actinoplanes teichomyceticus TaxID=1867 RepID=A0A561VRL9_ACTTI|nr:hypothetical protein [Actinoplanes teichomyceticus]TWG14267.1 hypothetical protein FHX34_104567 [Actinoplanes teichomyceticus]GIF13177.1 hypothetical protein Ate01nite_32090 [Actinoplanes teichomyceticus]
MTEQPEGAWRDEEKLPLKDLKQAMATWDTDGQNEPNDNDTGNQPGDDVRPSTVGPSGPQ